MNPSGGTTAETIRAHFTRAALPILLAVAAISTVLQLYYGEWASFAAHFENANIARSLSARGVFGDPYGALPTGPTAHTTPMFPLFLGALMGIFGESPAFALAACGFCILAHLAFLALLLPASEMFFGSARPGWIAAAVSVAVPVFPVMPQYESIYAAAGSLLYCLAARRTIAAPAASLYKLAFLGLAGGALLLTSSTTLFVVIGWPAWLLARTRMPRRRAAAAAGSILFGVLLPPSIWALRNQRVLGAPVFLRDNMGLEIALSNNDYAHPRQTENMAAGVFHRFHPTMNRHEAEKVKELGEIEYNRRKMEQARAWIAGHPGRFARLTLERVFDYWFPWTNRFYGKALSILTGVSFFGLWLAARRRMPAAAFLAGILLLTPLPFYIVHTHLRLRLPVVWITMLLGGLAVDLVWRRKSAAPKPPPLDLSGYHRTE